MWSKLISDVQICFKGFCAYVKRNRYAVIALTAYTFLIHFRLLTSSLPGIDTESIINDSNEIYNSWLGIGRQGLYWIKLLLCNKHFNPTFAVMVALLFLILVCLLVPFLAEIVTDRIQGFKAEAWLILLFGAVVVSHPIFTEQLYFTLQSAEVATALLLVVFGLFSAHHWSNRKNPLWLIPVLLLMPIAFSTYQAMVPLFIAGAAAMTFLRSLTTGESIGKQFGYVLRLVVAFLIPFLINQLITSLFFTKTAYLSSHFYWGRLGFADILRQILTHMRDALRGLGSFYFPEFGIGCIILLGLMIWHFHKVHKTSVILWQLFLLFTVYAAPFYLSIFLGGRPVIRAQLVLPFISGLVIALCGYFFLSWNIFSGRKTVQFIATLLLSALCIITVYDEASVTERIYYSNEVRAQADLQLASQLQRDIQIFTGEYDYDGVVIFLGRRNAAQNPSCIQGDIMGQSFFNWDVDVEPMYFFSTKRIVGFMNCLGCSYTKPSPAQVQQATEYQDSMTCYPAEGSIIYCGDAVVIKLSNE